jgi:hypothetical protein
MHLDNLWVFEEIVKLSLHLLLLGQDGFDRRCLWLVGGGGTQLFLMLFLGWLFLWLTAIILRILHNVYAISQDILLNLKSVLASQILKVFHILMIDLIKNFL